jgi:hypothetical protein
MQASLPANPHSPKLQPFISDNTTAVNTSQPRQLPKANAFPCTSLDKHTDRRPTTFGRSNPALSDTAIPTVITDGGLYGTALTYKADIRTSPLTPTAPRNNIDLMDALHDDEVTQGGKGEILTTNKCVVEEV